MHSTLFRWLGLLTIAAYLVCAMTGCEEARAPINRVQPLALDKHFFVGANLSDTSDDPEFYFGTRIIDEPYGVGQDFELFQSIGTLARIKWEIEEDVLIARLTYDRVQNSDYYGAQSTDTGQIVAEFNVTSQFDIIRDYNPQTGEQLNVIVENTTDRPWYQRDYFRVDWSQNLVTDSWDFDQFAVAAGIDGVKLDPLQYTIEDPADPNSPVFDTDNGYFDVTTHLFATPQTIQTPYGTFPLCWFYGNGAVYTCNPSELTVRLSFKTVVPDDYEPEDWDGTKMNAFGWFTSDRFGYDRNYGILDQDWHRFAARYQIWTQSHVTGTQCAIDEWRDASGNVQLYQVDASGNYRADPTTGLPIPAAPGQPGQPFTLSAPGLDVHRDADNDGTEDECQFYDSNGGEVNAGSRCDEFTNKCDIPLYERQTKTTALYYGPTAPPDVFAASAHALNSWNISVKRATQLGKVVEANRVGVDVGQANFLTTEAALLADQANGPGMTVPDVFVLCHNPVIVGDAPACGAPGLVARLGDLRYHMVNVITNPQSPSAWGVMTDFNDPLTGEKVQASINVWDYQTDLASQYVEDLLHWLDGEISNAQIANGQYMSQWLSASKLSTAQYTPQILTTKEIQSRLNSIDRTIANANGLPAGQQLPPQLAATLAASNLAQSLGPPMDSQLEGTRTSLMGSQWEAQLLTPDMLQAAGFDPTQPFAGDPTTLTMASPLRGMDRRAMLWGKQQLDTALRVKAMCVMDDLQPEPDSLIGLARQAEQLFPQPNPKDASYPAELFERDQAEHQWIREQFHTSVIAHEMGHSMGLRHNFTGSFDALNYHTEYWQLRTRNGQEHYCGFPGALDATTPHTDGTDCVGPRWVDPVTDTESNDLIWKWASTTVMDYPGDQTQDMNDIGLYDKAAMRFGYADLVDVEKNMKYAAGVGGNTGGSGTDYLIAVDGFGGIWGSSIGQNHYSTYNDKYSVLGTCAPRPDWNGDPSDPLAQQCSGANLDYVAQRDMESVPKFDSAVLSVRPDLVANFAVAPSKHNGSSLEPSASGQSVTNAVRHPYMFGSDEYAYGNLPDLRFDSGADSYEQMQFLISTYEDRYIFNDFRRNRVTFTTGAVLTGLEGRYWDMAAWVTKALALGVELLTQPGNDPTTQAGSLMPAALGSSDGLAMFVRAMTRPAPGAYTVNAPQPGVTPNSWGGAWQLGDLNLETPPSTGVNVALGSGEGRFLDNDYDYTQGYWWSEYQLQVGSYYEKVLAPVYLTEAYNDFISNTEDDYIDGRYKNLSYMSIYPQQVRRIFANLMATNSATQVNGSGTVAQIFTTAPYAMPASTTNAPNPLTATQYLPWEKYDPTDPTTTTLQYPAGAVLLDPLVGWEEQYPALINLFWYGPTALNMDVIDLLRIFSPGDAASLSIPEDQQVRYRDPLTQIEYVAKNYGFESVNPQIGYQTAQGIGARMIQHANFLAQLGYQVTQAPDPVTGELTYDTDANGSSIPLTTSQATNAATFLKGYAANIDSVRQLTYFFGYGPLGH